MIMVMNRKIDKNKKRIKVMMTDWMNEDQDINVLRGSR